MKKYLQFFGILFSCFLTVTAYGQNVYAGIEIGVASSSVATATNKESLAEKIKLLTTKKLDFITSSVESKLIIKGSIPQRDYLNSVILDIGSGSIKGGVIELDKNKNYAFSPFGTKFGSKDKKQNQ
ncbi:unnamed protein product [Rotaria socialis]|uniref:Uncharacterized protein n=1 Tax=Rotaria socialis TaxID=392032 RepID=A0A820RM49_9BILA|nr:unnamed protein product [Rotaria socialis]